MSYRGLHSKMTEKPLTEIYASVMTEGEKRQQSYRKALKILAQKLHMPFPLTPNQPE